MAAVSQPIVFGKEKKDRVADCQKNKTAAHCYRIDIGPNYDHPEHGYALSPADKAVSPDLLVSTECIKGIECPGILAKGAPNYWDLAWEKLAKEYRKGDLNTIGMAVNSADPGFGRDRNQLHIHVRSIDSRVQNQLDRYDKGRKIETLRWGVLSIDDPTDIKGHGPHNYRVLRLEGDNDLGGHNLFELVYEELVKKYGAKAAENMQHQTLVVAKRQSGGFYVLNSDRLSP